MTSVDLLNRSLGTLTSTEFAHIENARLLEALQLQVWPQFGRQSVKKDAIIGQDIVVNNQINNGNDGVSSNGQMAGDAIAHRAGVNTIVIDRFEGR